MIDLIRRYSNGRKEGLYNPLLVVLWRMIWFIPVVITLLVFIIVYGIGFGPKDASRVLRHIGI